MERFAPYVLDRYAPSSFQTKLIDDILGHACPHGTRIDQRDKLFVSKIGES